MALDYVNDCVNENLAVLGIEGFLLKGDALHARTDLICDFSPLRPYLSWDEHRAQVNHTALTFLNHVTNNEHFVFQMQVITFEEWSNKGYGA